MSFPRHEQYTDSKSGWLGEYPSHWRAVPLWTLFRRTKRQGYADEELLSVYRDHGVVPKASRDDNNNKPSDDLSAYQLVEVGDLVVNKMKAWQGSVAISPVRGIVSPAYFTYQAVHEEDQRFLHYLMRSQRYITGYLSLSKGIRVNQWDLEPQYHSQMPVLIPPRDEQRRIADLLDHETAKIDALVEEQRLLIDLLNEKRQAVISQAVTKGVSQNAPMKDSGVEWLGKVPAHWEVGPMKRFWSVTDCKHITAEFVEDGIPLASIREVQGWEVALGDAKRTTFECYEQLIEGDRKPQPWDIIFTRNATVGEAALVPDDAPIFAMGQDVCLLRRRDTTYSGPFMLRQLKSTVIERQLNAIMIGSTFKRINVEEIRSMTICMPPPDEQHQIAEALAAQVGHFDELLDKAVAATCLLGERRTALISAAVTGKIDVRGLVPQPEAAAA